MTSRPIIFSVPMVRAILEGRKSQTRRVLKPQPQEDIGLWLAEKGDPYAVGDRLWVREAWTYINHQDGPRGLEVCIGYNADGESLPNRPSLLTGPGWDDKVDRWPFIRRRRSPIHMPRWASRLTLTVTDVRVQRLQEISEEDVIAEGVDPIASELVSFRGHYSGDGRVLTSQETRTRRPAFARLWNSIHGPDAWAVNPWVAPISFDAIPANIDGARPHA